MPQKYFRTYDLHVSKPTNNIKITVASVTATLKNKKNLSTYNSMPFSTMNKIREKQGP